MQVPLKVAQRTNALINREQKDVYHGQNRERVLNEGSEAKSWSVYGGGMISNEFKSCPHMWNKMARIQKK